MNPNSVYIEQGINDWEITRAIPPDEEKDWGATESVNVYNMATAVGARGFQYYGGLMDQMMDEIQLNTARLNTVNQMKNWTLSDWNDVGLADVRNQQLQELGLIGSTTEGTSAFVSYLDANGVNVTLRLNYPPSLYDGTYPADGMLNVDLPSGQLWQSTDDPPKIFYLPGTGGPTYLATNTPLTSSFLPTAEQLATWQGQAHDRVNELTQLSQRQQVHLQDLIAGYNKFMNFVSNVMQRKERDLQGIADRF